MIFQGNGDVFKEVRDLKEVTYTEIVSAGHRLYNVLKPTNREAEWDDHCV